MTKYILKYLYLKSPNVLKRILTFLYDYYGYFYCISMRYFDKKKYSNRKDVSKNNNKKRILIYHLSGLSFGGTEKFLQIIAKYLNKEKYDVYFMYSTIDRINNTEQVYNRYRYLQDQNIKMIDFNYTDFRNKYPYFLREMKPDIRDVIRDNGIDIILTATDGHTEFPINIIRKVPIIIINIFGAPNLQKNIVKNICISNEVSSKIEGIIPKKKIDIIYIPSERPGPDSKVNGHNLRRRLLIDDTDFVFGRIGRSSDDIFDPIAIEAFQRVVMKYQKAHYIIMSPPPILIKIVNEKRIPNVHFINPSSNEDDIWMFHQSIDCLAHFRKDGESCGLNIAESMLCGKPVISHRSRIWNAHLEYLDKEFSMIADIDNVDQYTDSMIKMIKHKEEGSLEKIGAIAKKVAENLFLIDNSINKIENIIDLNLKK